MGGIWVGLPNFAQKSENISIPMLGVRLNSKPQENLRERCFSHIVPLSAEAALSVIKWNKLK